MFVMNLNKKSNYFNLVFSCVSHVLLKTYPKSMSERLETCDKKDYYRASHHVTGDLELSCSISCLNWTLVTKLSTDGLVPDNRAAGWWSMEVSNYSIHSDCHTLQLEFRTIHKFKFTFLFNTMFKQKFNPIPDRIKNWLHQLLIQLRILLRNRIFFRLYCIYLINHPPPLPAPIWDGVK